LSANGVRRAGVAHGGRAPHKQSVDSGDARFTEDSFMNEGSAHDDRPSDPLHGASVTAPTDTPTAFPIARPVASPAGIVRRLLDVEFLLYPLSRGQAVVDAIVVLALWFVLDAVAATIGISIAASQHG